MPTPLTHRQTKASRANTEANATPFNSNTYNQDNVNEACRQPTHHDCEILARHESKTCSRHSCAARKAGRERIGGEQRWAMKKGLDLPKGSRGPEYLVRESAVNLEVDVDVQIRSDHLCLRQRDERVVAQLGDEQRLVADDVDQR